MACLKKKEFMKNSLNKSLHRNLPSGPFCFRSTSLRYSSSSRSVNLLKGFGAVLTITRGWYSFSIIAFDAVTNSPWISKTNCHQTSRWFTDPNLKQLLRWHSNNKCWSRVRLSEINFVAWRENFTIICYLVHKGWILKWNQMVQCGPEVTSCLPPLYPWR